MNQGPWADFVKLQQQQNQFHNNANSVNNLNHRNNGQTAAAAAVIHHQQQQNAACYNHLNNFNQNQMYTQNMETILAHYNSGREENAFNSHHHHHHHNTYDAEFFQNQFQNAKASLSAAGLFKSTSSTSSSSSKTKDNQHYVANNQLNANNLNNLNHDANFLSQHLPPNWRHSANLHNMNTDVNNQQTKPFGVLPHQASNSQNGQLHSNSKYHHSHHAYANSGELNGHHNSSINPILSSANASKHQCAEQQQTRHQNGHQSMKQLNQSANVNNLLPAMIQHQNLMQNSVVVNNQLNNSTINKHCNNLIENQAILHNSSKSNLHKNQIPHHSTSQAADQYLIAMNNQQKMLMNAQARFNQAQQLVNQQRATQSNQQHNGSSTSSSTMNSHANFQKNFMNSQNSSACLINNNTHLMNKTFNNAMVNNTYCSMMMGGIQINNYNVSNHNNLIISNQTPTNTCSSSSSNNASNGGHGVVSSVTNQQTVNNFIMNNMNNLNNLNNLNNNGNNLSNSRCSSVASVNNASVQQINESSSCSYGNFSTNSPSFPILATASTPNNHSPSSNQRTLNSSQQQLNSTTSTTTTNVPNDHFNTNYNLAANSSSSSFSHSNTPALPSTPGYPTPPSSVNRSDIMSQQSIQSQDEQLMQTHFNQNQFNGCNTLISSYNKLTNQTNGYSNGGSLINASSSNSNSLPDANNSANCLQNLMNITPVSDTMSDNGSKLNDSQCSTNAVNLNHMNNHSQHMNTNNSGLQFGDHENSIANIVSASEQQHQIGFHANHNQNSNELIVQNGKKKKEKSRKKKKKVTNSLANCNLINENDTYYYNVVQNQNSYPVAYETANNNCNGYFLNHIQPLSQQPQNFHSTEHTVHQDQINNLQSADGQLLQQQQQSQPQSQPQQHQHQDEPSHHHMNSHLNATQQNCMFDASNQQTNAFQLVNGNLNDSNCSNEQMGSLMSTSQLNENEAHHHALCSSNSATIEDKLDSLEEDLKYLTESNACMLDEDKDLSDEKAYTSDNNSVNNSCSLDDSMMRHHQHQLMNGDQTSLNCSLNGTTLMNESISNQSLNRSPIDDLNNGKHQYEFNESNLEYEKEDYDLEREVLTHRENGSCSGKNFGALNATEEKRSKKKKKKDKTKYRPNGLMVSKHDSELSLNAKSSSSSSKGNCSTMLLENNLLVKMNSATCTDAKKCKIERDEYEFTDEFASTLDAGGSFSECSPVLSTSGKKRKKINCENVNKKNKMSMNSLNEELIKTFNSTKEKQKEDKQTKSRLKVLTSSKGTNHSIDYAKSNSVNSLSSVNSVNSVNSVETSSTTSSSSSTSFSLNSKKENQELIASSKRTGNHTNGQLLVTANINGAINSKSTGVILNTNNQNVVQINNKKIITGKNINNQIESKKNEVISILNKSDSKLAKSDTKKALINGTKTEMNNMKITSKTSSTSTAVASNDTSGSMNISSSTAKRRSSEKKALTVREGLMRTSDFVISKEALEKNLSLLWRIEGKSLLQLFTPVEENGSLFYQNTSSYSAWNPTLREKYVGVDVRIMGCNRNKITVEKLSINKSSGNIDEKLLNKDAKDDLNNSLFSPAQHSTDFAVYIQTLISQILDPHFIREIIEDNDEYFLKHIQKIDECCLSKKAKIYSKIKWETSIIKCIETYPRCEADPQENSGDLRCKFCYEKWSTQILNFTGQTYDPITLEHLRNDELKLNKYAACDPCKNKVHALSELLHQKYYFYAKCGEKVEEMREGDDTKESHIILEHCLKDADWIDSLFKQLKEIWSAAEKF